MTTPARIVVGYDSSPDAQGAVDWATGFATATGAELTVVSAWDWPTYVGSMVPVDYAPDEIAQKQVRDLLPRIGLPPDRIRTDVVRGNAAQVLCDAAREAELLVLGSRGLGTFASTVLGSVSSACAGHAPCPVVIVRPPRSENARGVVVGVDGSDASRAALHWAMAYADAIGEPLTAVYCVHPEPFGPQFGYAVTYDRHALLKEARSWLEDFVAKEVADRGHALPAGYTTLAVEGGAAEVLHERFRDARIVVVGRRGAGGFRRLILGSVSHALAHHAEGTLAIVPAETRR